MFHRLMVLFTSINIIRVYKTARGEFAVGSQMHKIATVAFWIFIGQVIVGALKVSLAFPILLLGLHVALASALWLTFVILASLAGLQKNLA